MIFAFQSYALTRGFSQLLLIHIFILYFANFSKALKNWHKAKGINRAPLLELVLDGVLFAFSANTLHLALLFQLPPHLVIFLTPCVKL